MQKEAAIYITKLHNDNLMKKLISKSMNTRSTNEIEEKAISETLKRTLKTTTNRKNRK